MEEKQEKGRFAAAVFGCDGISVLDLIRALLINNGALVGARGRSAIR